MAVIGISTENNIIREKFFKLAFGDNEGIVALASKEGDNFAEIYFDYPANIKGILEWINNNINNRNLYFCPQLLQAPKRVKGNVITCPTVWADLDEADPKTFKWKPSVTITSSPGRYQGLWVLKDIAAPLDAERASRRLAYSVGADTSGWDLTQLLRIPLTYNMKYVDPPIVGFEASTITYSIKEFLDLPEPEEYTRSNIEFPEAEIAELVPEEILKKYRNKLLPSVFMWYTTAPDADWSSTLWSLECMILEAGMTLPEAFVICWNSAVNKYKRDGRSPIDMWNEIVKAKTSVDINMADESKPPVDSRPLLTAEEMAHLKTLPDTFVERWSAWVATRSDAPETYREVGGLVLLSALLSSNVVIPAEYDDIAPNLWFMILGDSAVSRKSTIMNMIINTLRLVYPECLLATSASIEGLLSELSLRPGKTSLFWRDEFAGMLKEIKKKEYMSGMREAFTGFYDGQYQKRVLKSGTYEINDPRFLLLVGGIEEDILELVEREDVKSGFLPRFIFVRDEDNDDKVMERFKPTTFGRKRSNDVKDTLIAELMTIKENYDTEMILKIEDQEIHNRQVWEAIVTPDAEARYQELESTLREVAVKSDMPDMFKPTLIRLGAITQKVAALIAASRQDPNEHNGVLIELDDMLKAIGLANKWKDTAIHVTIASGKSISEKNLERALKLIQGGKETRAALMRSMHLSARETDHILDTLEQRGNIVRTRQGKKEILHTAALQ